MHQGGGSPETVLVEKRTQRLVPRAPGSMPFPRISCGSRIGISRIVEF